MAQHLLQLSNSDRRDIYRAAADRLGLPALIVEKDVWICWALQTVFSHGDVLPMAFKGGTSLSKVFGVIKRFSEDVDLTVGFGAMPEALPSSRNQRDKLSATLRGLVANHLAENVRPHLIRSLERDSLSATVILADPETLSIHYPSCFNNRGGYIATQVRLEFGGRNRIAPSDVHDVRPYVAELNLPVRIPTATVNVLSPARTFWEKVTLAHAACAASDWRSDADRFARHWYDLALLADHRIADQALVEHALLHDVVAVKSAFWSKSGVSYEKCLAGECRLVPDGRLLVGLRQDYEMMIRAGMFSEAPPTFDDVVQRLRALEARINAEFTRRPGTD